MSTAQRGSLEGIFSPVKVQLSPRPELRVETTSPDPVTETDGSALHAGHSTDPDARGIIHNVAVYLPVALRDLLRDHSRARGLTITQVVEEAFEEHGSDYGELAGTRSAAPGSMPTRVSVRRAGATIQVQLRLDQRQHEWLDSQVERFGAPNRSALVSAVLVRHLSPS